MDRFFLLQMGADAPSLLPYGAHDPMLVVLSVCLAIFASTMALHATEQARVLTQSRLRSVTLLAGSLALGCGVWGMHFIGMLAYQLCTTVTYNTDLTTASVLPSVGASWVALRLLASDRVSNLELVIAGVLVGAGIGAMHYTGMAAMQMSAALRYDPWMFALSIVVAVALAVLALWVRHGLAVRLPRYDGWRLTLASGVVMGMAISGMHYTGMAAARFVGTPTQEFDVGTANRIPLALGITLVTVVASVLVGAAVGLARYRQLLARVQSKEARLQAITETSMDAIVVFDEQGMVHKYNASAERIFGVPASEMLGHSVTHIMVEPYKSLATASFDQFLGAVSHAMGIELESHCLHTDGRRIPIRLVMGRMVSLQERLYVAFITDISERQRMEIELRDREAQFRSLISNIPGISYRCRMEPGWPMVYISEAAERVTGWPTSAFMGTPPLISFANLVAADDVKRIGAIVKQAAEAETPFVLEFQLRTRSGELRWMWGHGSIVRAVDNSSVKWIDGVLLDITERREMEDELVRAKEKAEAAAQARTSFLANMSHEIRTPMNAILGFTDFVLDGELQPAQRKHLETVHKSARSLLHLLNDILDTSKLDRGALEIESLPFSLPELVHQLCAEQSIQADRKRLKLHGSVPVEVGDVVQGDPHRLRQILLNLLGNAIKFTERGEVELSCQREGERVHFRVRDTGIGIVPERQATIFEAFTQADASMSRRFGGTGLGTTIAKQLTELMGGRIWVESTPGIGSTFHVDLPLPISTEAAADSSQTEGGPLQLPPLRILVVDDVPQNTELVCVVMGRQGHQLSVAHDGREALARYGEQAFDVVLMDVQMPVMDGLSACRAIRELEARRGSPRTPVIALSASVLDEDRAAALASGMDGFASKPLDLDALSREIARVTGCTPLGAAVAADTLVPTHDDDVCLDPVTGVKRWGDRASWMGALQRFARAQALPHHDHDLDAEAQKATAHRLRGAAANLGLPQLTRAAGVVEGLHADAPAEHRQAAWHALQAAMAAVQQAVNEAAASDPPAAPPTQAASTQATQLDDATRQRLLQQAHALRPAFGRGECRDDELDALCEAWRPHASEQRLAALKQAADDFDFESALALLDALMGELPAPEALDHA